MTVDVELTRIVDGPDVVATLAAQGLDGELAADGRHVTVSVEDPGKVGHALDAWTLRSGLPFVPLQIGSQRFVLAPPPA